VKMSRATGTPAYARVRSLVAIVALVTVVGCKPRSDEGHQTKSTPGPGPAEIASVRDGMTRGMQEVAFDSLTPAQIGKQCVVIARQAGDQTGNDSAPPPLGMVLRLGQTTIYKGEIQELSSDHLTIRAPYPTSGRYKTIELPRSEIESIHLAK